MKLGWAVLIFAAGLAGGWLIRGEGRFKGNPNTAREDASASARKRDTRPEKPAHELKWQTFAKNFDNYGDSEVQEFKAGLKHQDRAAALDALLTLCGPFEVNEKASALVSEILGQWADDDFEEAWLWSHQLSNAGTQRFIKGELLERLATKDPERSLQLYLKEAAEDREFGVPAPGKLMSLRASEGAAEFLDLISKVPPVNWGGGILGYGEPMDYAKNFDFHLAANGIENLRSKPGRFSEVRYPTDFYRVWAAKEPEAAFDWWVAHPSGRLSVSEDRDILEGVRKNIGTDADVAWFVDKLMERESPRGRIMEAFSGSEVFKEQIMKALPDDAARDAVTFDDELKHRSLITIEDTKSLLPRLSSPEARIEALQRISAKRNSINPNEISDARLEEWGVTRQQVKAIFPNPPADAK